MALLPGAWAGIATALVDGMVLAIAGVTGYQSIALLVFRQHEITPILGISASWIAVPLTASMAVLAIYAAHRLLAQSMRTVALAAGVLLACAVVFIGALALLGQAPSSNTSLSVALVIVLATVLIGLPIAFALMLGTIVFLYMGGIVSMVALPQNMVDGTGRFVLLALPFFIFAGIVMERGGISRRLVSFVAAVVGGIRGGLLQVMVVSMYIVSGISGSKAADVAAVGLVMRDMLEKEKYDMDQSAALLAASAAMGECIPPSLAMLVLGSVTSLSVAALFAGGLIPAAVIALCLMALIWFASPRKVRQPRSTHMGRLALGAVIPFTMPVFLFAGILLGFATPTEVSAFAVAYGLLIAVVLYRETACATSPRWSPKRPPRPAWCSSRWRGAVVLLGAVRGGASASSRGIGDDVGERSDAVPARVGDRADSAGVAARGIAGDPDPSAAPGAARTPGRRRSVALRDRAAGRDGHRAPSCHPLGVGFYIACSVVRGHADRATRAMIPYSRAVGRRDAGRVRCRGSRSTCRACCT
jgi:hypothetical protein